MGLKSKDFYRLCHEGDRESAIDLMRDNEDLNYPRKFERFCVDGHERVFECLLKNYKITNKEYQFNVGFVLACALGNEGIIKVFLDSKDDNKKPSLSKSIMLSQNDGSFSALYYLFNNKMFDIIKMLFSEDKYDSLIGVDEIMELIKIDVFCNKTNDNILSDLYKNYIGDVDRNEIIKLKNNNNTLFKTFMNQTMIAIKRKNLTHRNPNPEKITIIKNICTFNLILSQE